LTTAEILKKIIAEQNGLGMKIYKNEFESMFKKIGERYVHL
jgi:hypothetical protein